MPSCSKWVPVMPVHEMKWGKLPDNHPNQSVKWLTGSEIANVLKIVSELGSSCPLVRIIEPFATTISEDTNKILDCTFNILNAKYLGKPYIELLQITNSLKFSMS